MKKYLGSILFCLSIFAAVVGFQIGCTSDGKLDFRVPTTQEVDTVKAQIETGRKATTQTIADTQAELDKLPPNDPVRKQLEDKITSLNKTLAQANDYLDKANKVVTSLQTGDTTGLISVASAVPYGGLVVFGATTLWSLYSRATHRSALEQVVKSVDETFPDKTEAQKQSLSAVQDQKTRQLVSAIKGD
jgi:paraquat-inducible protein B